MGNSTISISLSDCTEHYREYNQSNDNTKYLTFILRSLCFFTLILGLEPLLPIYQRGILYGSPTVREASAAGLGEVIAITGSKYLAGPLIVKMTGPLLRIVGDRNPSNVKIAILETLGLILTKGGPALRAFVPQFQTTFVKALADPSRQVRVHAISALGLLMPLSTRVDPLLKELVAGSTSSEAVAVQTATLEALATVLETGGQKAKAADSIPNSLEAGLSLLSHADDTIREAAGKVVGAACNLSGFDGTVNVVHDTILSGNGSDKPEVKHGRACAIRYICNADIAKDLGGASVKELIDLCCQYAKEENSLVQQAGCVALGAAVGRAQDPQSALRDVESIFTDIMQDRKSSLELHHAVAQGLCLALLLSQADDRVSFLGLNLMNACIKLALSGAQRTQFSFNEVLYLALSMDRNDGSAALEVFGNLAMFEDSKKLKSLYAKVLQKIQQVTIV